MAPPDYNTEIDPEYVTEWPYHYYQPGHEFGPDLLSVWKASLDTWDGWENLFTESVIQDNDPENYDEYTSLDGSSWNSTQSGRYKNGLWLTPRNGDSYVTELSGIATWTAVRETERSGPDEEGDYSCEGTQNCAATANNVGSDYFADVTSGSYSQTCISSDVHDSHAICWNSTGLSDVYSCESSGYLGGFRDASKYDWMFQSRADFDNVSHYNETAGAIIQMFSCKAMAWSESSYYAYHGYGTCNTGVSNVVATDEEEAIAPNTLSETTGLSDALKDLVETSETISISTSFLIPSA